MANNVSQAGVLILDTAADNIVAAGIRVQIHKIRWQGGTTAAHVAEITDAGGSVVKWREVANAANYSAVDYCDPPLVLNGLKLTTLSSGVLFIYTRG